ncbi:hypothetical protein BDV98DRAFT_579808 [Pterulicium gracile]|uniref:Uncharacterized protein n=1 Tax=Pterulicium gracile TaxID=1884261 RepID=A0A5C3QUC1_9AGAR|nr:hypothetical protein BDV98DRAFT_579808 [Pterula gracilis]
MLYASPIFSDSDSDYASSQTLSPAQPEAAQMSSADTQGEADLKDSCEQSVVGETLCSDDVKHDSHPETHEHQPSDSQPKAASRAHDSESPSALVTDKEQESTANTSALCGGADASSPTEHSSIGVDDADGPLKPVHVSDFEASTTEKPIEMEEDAHIRSAVENSPFSGPAALPSVPARFQGEPTTVAGPRQEPM